MTDLLFERAESMASRLAKTYLARNLAALAPIDPDTAERLRELDPAHADGWEWVLGRDGALTGRLPGPEGRPGWFNGCGVPAAAGEQLVSRAGIKGPGLILAAPTHGRQITAMLDRLAPSHALVTVFEDAVTAAFAVRCVDLADEIQSGQLHLVVPENAEGVPDAVANVFDRAPGLPILTSVFRPGAADEEQAQSLISRITTGLGMASGRREQRVVAAVASWQSPRSERLCVVAGSGFAPFEGAGQTLWDALRNEPADRVDVDQPISASVAAITLSAATCSAVVAADLLRSDLPSAVSAAQRWLTWVTRPRAIVPKPTSRLDAVLLVEPAWEKAWRSAGWSTEQVAIAEWPGSPMANDGQGVSLVADLPESDVPEQVERYSSHRWLWEAIQEELGRQPLVCREARAYLADRARQAGVELSALPVELFIERCLMPAYQRGVVAMLERERVKLDIYGRGWEGTQNWQGPCDSRQALRRILGESGVVLHASPTAAGGAIRYCGRPVVTTAGRSKNELLTVLRHPPMAETPRCPLTGESVRELLDRLHGQPIAMAA